MLRLVLLLANARDIPSFFLSLLFQDSNEIHFRVKMTTQMGKLKKSYSDRVVGFIRFSFYDSADFFKSNIEI